MQLKQCKVEKMCSSNCDAILYFILSVIMVFEMLMTRSVKYGVVTSWS